MSRLRLYDMRTSRLPALIGLNPADTPGIARYTNSAQRRLILAREAGEEGWHGSFAEVDFTQVGRNTPYITCPREIARIEAINICQRTVPINNQFVEYLQFGNGRMPRRYASQGQWAAPQVYSRNNAVTFVDMPKPGMFLRAFTTSSADVEAGLRVFFQGMDAYDAQIYTQDNLNEVMGQFVSFDTPFSQTPQVFNSITGIQKDVTAGQIQIFAVDAVTGDQFLLLNMDPGETVAGYRRYYLHDLPASCFQYGPIGNYCYPKPNCRVTVTAIVKLEPIPVVVDTDYLLLHNLEAMIEEGRSVYYSEMSETQAISIAQECHVQAIRLLNSELRHYYGKNEPAVSFKPFGSASLERQKVGCII